MGEVEPSQVRKKEKKREKNETLGEVEPSQVRERDESIETSSPPPPPPPLTPLPLPPTPYPTPYPSPLPQPLRSVLSSCSSSKPITNPHQQPSSPTLIRPHHLTSSTPQSNSLSHKKNQPHQKKTNPDSPPSWRTFHSQLSPELLPNYSLITP